MELRHLRYFIAVAEEENVSRAALNLHVSQPALSRQIRDLEDEIGFLLLKRTAKSVRLTDAGKVFLEEARAVIQRSQEAVKKAKVIATGERGTLRVGYAPSLTVELLPLALRAFERECPGVRVMLHDLSSEECIRGLNGKKIDLALTVRPRQLPPGLEFEKLAEYPICCTMAASHPLAKKRSVSLAQLKGERFVIYSREEYPEACAWLDRLFEPHGVSLKDAEEHDGATGLITAIEAGHGISIVSASFKCMAGPRLCLVPVRPAPPPLVVGALKAADPGKWVEQFVSCAKPAPAR